MAGMANMITIKTAPANIAWLIYYYSVNVLQSRFVAAERVVATDPHGPGHVINLNL
jgi:hypothetical protein